MQINLRHELKHAYSIIKRRLSDADVSAWLSDNFYCIDRHYRLIIDNRTAMRCRDFYSILKNYCERRDCLPTPKGLIKWLAAQSRSFSFDELTSVRALLAACAITQIASSLTDRSRAFLLPNAVKTLHSLSDPDYDEVVSSLWSAERILLRHEEAYDRSDAATKSQYRSRLAAYARRKRISEPDAAEALVFEAKSKKTTVGGLLFAPKIKDAALWIATLCIVLAALTAASVTLIGWWSALLLAVPFAVASSAVADRFVSYFVPAHRAPRLELTRVPDDAKTLVTVASLMTGGSGDCKVFESLERFRYMNRDKNVYFCLLADLPDSDSQYLLNDSAIIESARRRIDELNRVHGDCFCLFFRERTLNASEGKYGGWERKRGAVCELASHIAHGGKSEYYGGDFIRDIKYILTLDSDTNLSVGSVLELVSIALHPVNRPSVRDGRVVSGYGIIQPSVRTELKSAYSTGFSRLISGSGGADNYSTASFSRGQSLFGSGSFCGKGLIDVRLFDSLVAKKLPEGLVLSHDILEGSVLRTLCASEVTLTDSTPGNTVSFFRRQHRWMRGDFQNLCFVRGRLLSGFSKLRLLLIASRHLSPIFSTLAVIVGAFESSKSGFVILLLAYADLFIPTAQSIASFLLSSSPFACLRFFSRAYSMLVQTLMRLFFEISSSLRRALLTLNALVLAVYRCFTREKTLEWTTAAQVEGLGASLGKYVLDGGVSAAAGLALLMLARNPAMRLAGLLYFVYPLVSVVLSRSVGGGREVRPLLGERQKRLLEIHATDMLGFYLDNVGSATSHLPPDNIQTSPVQDVAMRTSPTNIGFYLVSLLAARDLCLLSTAELCTRLEDSIGVIERLEKYKGNLYNWYDLNDTSVLGDKYLSAVDSGNLYVMLIALKEGMRDYASEDERVGRLSLRLSELIEGTDLSVFYDKRRALFRIGLSGEEHAPDGAYYDMLMSEARMLSYCVVANGAVPKKHWQTLGRTLTHYRGYIGMMSWSGTAFEYLMPHLFLPLYRDSFMYESVAFSLMVQRRELELWGISESGYYSFDSEMHYQYKANGIQRLALRRVSEQERVASPYSTYLSLCTLGFSAVKNLQAFENRGMYGRYGLYEAIDFSSGDGLLVKSYMAHHVGMSVIACLNAIKDNIFVRRFTASKQMSSALELLQEKIPTDAHVFGNDSENREEIKRVKPQGRSQTEGIDLQSPSAVLLNRGDLTAVVTSSGHIGLTSGDRMLSHTQFDKSSLRFSPSVVFARAGKGYCCAPLSGQSGVSFERGGNYASHIVSDSEFSGRVRYSISGNCFVISTRAESLKRYDVTLSLEPALESRKKYTSHISFSRLFIESEYDKQRRILFFHRRSGLDGRHIFTLAVALRDRNAELGFLTSRESLKAFSINTPLDYAALETDNAVGACIDPICLVRAVSADGGRATFLLTCGETKQECIKSIKGAREGLRDSAVTVQSEMTNRLLPSLLYPKEASIRENFSECGINELWSRGISGDYPLVTARISELAVSRTESLIEAYLTLTRAFIRLELIFIIEEEDRYGRPVERTLRECLKRSGGEQYLGVSGGIFILRREEISDTLADGLRENSSVCIDFSDDGRAVQSRAVPIRDIITAVNEPRALKQGEAALSTSHGFFENDSFTVDKRSPADAPYSFVLTGRRFSTVVTQSSLGYTFYDNARERRLCSFYGDAKTHCDGERVLAVLDGRCYDLCAISSRVVYEKGCASYYGSVCGCEYRLTVVVPPKYPVKLIRVKYQKGSVETRLAVKPVMGDSVSPIGTLEVVPYFSDGNSALLLRSVFGMTFPEGRGFAGVCGGRIDGESLELVQDSSDALFFLGACTTLLGVKQVISRIDRRFFDESAELARSFAESMVPRLSVTTHSRAHDTMMRFFAPYQVAACRFFARGSFYQSGGAYGFRDQLQDCLTLVYAMPSDVRTHIIRCCAHQYLDGSVMHWWHTRNINRVNSGIRSKCSDDMLYLPIVVADYIEKTGDRGLLDVETYYLTSRPLSSEESERYETPERSDLKESVYRHCLRALSYADKRGRHGLILMGSCDWNDAFSLVGRRGIGESVFSSMLFIVAAERFLPIVRSLGDAEAEKGMVDAISEIRSAIEKNAYFKDRYARAFCDDGSVIGTEGCEECEIDILSQAFAVLAGMDASRAKNALKLAFSKLYDGRSKLFKLFSPPFENKSTRVGYIRGYVAGIRENGGQYTHGALWGALGCIAAGLNEEALLILDCVNPIVRSTDRSLASRYKIEPYAVAADIYSGSHSGRGGWSWYTGAASWYYRIMLEYVLGIRVGANQALLSARPVIEYEMDLTFGSCELHITASAGNDRCLLDGEPTELPLTLPEGRHSLELRVE